MKRHHAQLVAELDERVEGVRRALPAGAAGEDGGSPGAVGELVAFVRTEVLPHAMAEENTVYAAGGAMAELVSTMDEMRAEHRRLASFVTELESHTDPAAAAAAAEELARLFREHVRKENEIVLPALLADEKADLAGLLGAMHHHIEEGGSRPSA